MFRRSFGAWEWSERVRARLCAYLNAENGSETINLGHIRFMNKSDSSKRKPYMHIYGDILTLSAENPSASSILSTFFFLFHVEYSLPIYSWTDSCSVFAMYRNRWWFASQTMFLIFHITNNASLVSESNRHSWLMCHDIMAKLLVRPFKGHIIYESRFVYANERRNTPNCVAFYTRSLFFRTISNHFRIISMKMEGLWGYWLAPINWSLPIRACGWPILRAI